MTVDLLKIAKRLALVAGVSVVCASGAYAQSSSSDSASATAVIITPIHIAKSVDMVFGNLVADTAASTVILSPLGVVTIGTGAASIPGTQGGTPTAAAFDVTGQGTFTYTVTMPANVILSDGATHTITVDTWTTDLAGGLFTAGVLTAGAQTFHVGATLNLGAAQVPGTYSNTFSVSVQYN